MKDRKAWIYSRVKHTGQPCDEAEFQTQLLRDYAAKNGMTVIGLSSDMGDEPLVNRMGIGCVTEAAEVGKIDVLLVLDMEQISDCEDDITEYLQLLEKYGVQVEVVQDGDDADA